MNTAQKLFESFYDIIAWEGKGHITPAKVRSTQRMVRHMSRWNNAPRNTVQSRRQRRAIQRELAKGKLMKTDPHRKTGGVTEYYD